MGLVGARSQKLNPSFLNKTMEKTGKTWPSASFTLTYRGIATPRLMLDLDSSVGLPRSISLVEPHEDKDKFHSKCCYEKTCFLKECLVVLDLFDVKVSNCFIMVVA